jgi:hypothetical protein
VTVHVRVLALLFGLSGGLGGACSCGACGWAAGYFSGVIPDLLRARQTAPMASAAPGEIAAAYLVAALVLGLSVAPQWVAAWALLRGRAWAKQACVAGSIAALASCLPAGCVALLLTLRLPGRAKVVPPAEDY